MISRLMVVRSIRYSVNEPKDNVARLRFLLNELDEMVRWQSVKGARLRFYNPVQHKIVVPDGRGFQSHSHQHILSPVPGIILSPQGTKRVFCNAIVHVSLRPFPRQTRCINREYVSSTQLTESCLLLCHVSMMLRTFCKPAGLVT
jgi:hypothetical protein